MALDIICDKWDGTGGGCEQYLFDLASHAAGRGIAVNIQARRVLAPGKETSGIRVFKHNGTFRTNKTVLAIRPFEGATHYQLHSGLYAAGFRGEREAMPNFFRRFFYPLAQSLNLKRQRLIGRQDRWLRNPNRPFLMVFSRLTARELENRYGMDPAAIHINPHGVNLNRFSPPRKERILQTIHMRKKPHFLFVANNFMLKGLQPLLEAIGILRQKGSEIYLRVAGSGRAGSFKRLAEKLEIRSQISFLGHVPRNDLAPLYGGSVALVHPTFYDPCSLVVPEALACGCPVVTTRNNGAAELIHSGKDGFVLDDPRNVGALCRVLQMLADPRRAKEMGQAALETAPRLNIRRHMAETLKWLGFPEE